MRLDQPGNDCDRGDVFRTESAEDRRFVFPNRMHRPGLHEELQQVLLDPKLRANLLVGQGDPARDRSGIIDFVDVDDFERQIRFAEFHARFLLVLVVFLHASILIKNRETARSRIPVKKDRRSIVFPQEILIAGIRIDKSRSVSKIHRPTKEGTHEILMANIPGGNYTAEFDSSDGTYTIKDVPIMAELPQGARQNEDGPISSDWFAKAIERHEELEKFQGFLAPVHTNHHDLGRTVERAGFLRLSRVGEVMQNGTMVPALFADIVGMSEEHFARVQANDLPYRSVEIASWEEGREEVSSLALLSDESPWFRLPMLSVREIVESEESPMGSAGPLVAMGARESGDGEMMLFKFLTKDESMADQKTTEARIALQENGDDGDEKKKDEDQDDDAIKLQEGTDDIAAQLASMVADFQATIPDLVAEYIATLTPGGDSVDEELPLEDDAAPAPIELQEDDSETEDEDEKFPVPPMQKRAAYREGKKSIMFAELAGRVAALENTQVARKKSDRLETLVARSVDSLRAGGWSVTEPTIIAMREIAADSRSPSKAVKTHAPRDPASTFMAFDGTVAGDPPDVAKFSAAGPGSLERARQLAVEYDQLKDSGFNFSVSREDHIRENING